MQTRIFVVRQLKLWSRFEASAPSALCHVQAAAMVYPEYQ